MIEPWASNDREMAYPWGEVYRLMFEQAGEGIFLSDEHGRFEEVNPRGCKMLGYSRDELLKKSISDLVDTDDLKALPLQFAQLRQDKAFVIERILQRKDGARIYAEITGTIVSDGHILGMVRDISERKKAEAALAESEQLYRELFELESDAIFLADVESGQVLMANGATAKLYGYTVEEFLKLKTVDFSAEPEHTRQAIQASKNTNQVVKIPVRYHCRKDGTIFPVELTARFFMRNGRSVHITAIRDITERLRAEQALKESELRYRSIVQMALDGFMLIDREGKIREVNEAYCRMSGYSETELLKMSLFNLEAKEDARDTQKHIQKIIEAGFDQFESIHHRKNGSSFYVEVSTIFLPVSGGLFFSFLHDVSDRKHMEMNLKKNESLMRLVLDNSPVFISYVRASDLTYEFANRQYQIGFGKSKEEIIGKTVRELIGDKGYEIAKPYIERALAGETTWYENIFNLTYGKRLVRLNYVPYIDGDSAKGIVVMGHDITDMREAQETVRTSEEKFSRVFKYAPILITISELETGKYLDINDKFVEISGFAREEIIGKTSTEIGWIGMEDRARLLEQFKQDGHIVNMELVLHPKSGHNIICLYNGEIIQIDGKARLLSMAQDITERKRAEETLRDSEYLLREAQKAGKFGHYVFYIQSNEWKSSDLLDIMFGIDSNYPHTAQGWIDIVHPDERREMSEYLGNHILGMGQNFNREYRIQRVVDGQVRWVHGLGKLEYDQVGRPARLIGTIQDITDRKSAETLLKTAYNEKETLLRELYHRTKNNMQVISSLLGLESDKVNNPQVYSIFKDMENRIKSMALVHQMLYQSQNLSSINLKEYIEDLTGLLIQSYEIESNRIKLRLVAEDVPVQIDTAIPCGLLINELVSNAFKHAFPENRSGKITITLRQSPEHDIKIKVSDNGIGVPPEFDFREQESLGMQTILALGEHQLQGKVTFTNKAGVSCLIEFRDDIYDARI